MWLLFSLFSSSLVDIKSFMTFEIYLPIILSVSSSKSLFATCSVSSLQYDHPPQRYGCRLYRGHGLVVLGVRYIWIDLDQYTLAVACSVTKHGDHPHTPSFRCLITIPEWHYSCASSMNVFTLMLLKLMRCNQSNIRSHERGSLLAREWIVTL